MVAEKKQKEEMEFCKFPSIEQFRHVVKDVEMKRKWEKEHRVGGEPKAETKTKTKITFTGTVKLHGTNAAVGYFRHGEKEELWCQTRNRLLSHTERDCFGFFDFFETNKDVFRGLFRDLLLKKKDANPEGESKIVLWGEWCGGNVQKGIALSKLPKMFVGFALASFGSGGGSGGSGVVEKEADSKEDEVAEKAEPEAEDEEAEDEEAETDRAGRKRVWWMEKEAFDCVKSPEHRIYSIFDYQTWTVEIDFDNAEKSSSLLQEITDQVEKECPVAKAFGVSGVGEGVVW